VTPDPRVVRDFAFAVHRGESKQTLKWEIILQFTEQDGERVDLLFPLSEGSAEDLAAQLERELAIIRSSGRN
jgi:hypothetical protein